MIIENWTWVERGSFPVGRQDKEMFYFHANLGKTAEGDDEIVLAGGCVIDHVNCKAKTQYAESYISNPRAGAIDPVNYPLQKEPFVKVFDPQSGYNGIPGAFFDNTASGFWKKLARNVPVYEPLSAPATPAQFLMEAVSSEGFWYFTPTRKLVRPFRMDLTCNAPAVKDGKNSLIDMSSEPVQTIRYI